MIRFIRETKVTKKVILSIIIFCLVSFLIGDFSLAGSVYDAPLTQGVGLAIATLLSWIAWVFIALLGWVLTVLISILVSVAQFGEIINVDTVIKGWVIIRDLCNMYFTAGKFQCQKNAAQTAFNGDSNKFFSVYFRFID